MITECAALIKTHDYRPQRTLEYQATVIPSQRGAPGAFSARSPSLNCRLQAVAFWRVVVSFSHSNHLTPSNNTAFRISILRGMHTGLHASLLIGKVKKSRSKLKIVPELLRPQRYLLLTLSTNVSRAINVNSRALINSGYIKPCVISLMDRYSSLYQSLSTVGVIATIGIKLSVLHFTVIVSLSNSPSNRSRRLPFSAT